MPIPLPLHFLTEERNQPRSLENSLRSVEKQQKPWDWHKGYLQMSASSLGHFPFSQLPPHPNQQILCGLNGAFTEELSHRLLPIGVHLCMRGVGVEEGVCLKQLILKNNPAGGLIMCFGAKEFEQKKKKNNIKIMATLLSYPLPHFLIWKLSDDSLWMFW